MARHVYACPMRWSDMDAYGHVNNVMFMRYLEEARIDLLLTAAGPAGRAMLDDGIVVVRHEVDYRAPLVHRVEPVAITSWVEEIKHASFTVAYVIADDGPGGRTEYVTARTVLVLVDLDTGRPRRIGPDDRAWLERFLDASTSTVSADPPVPT